MKFNKILLIGLFAAVIAASGCVSLQPDERQADEVEDEQQEDRFKNSQQLSVGEDAWANPVPVNITHRIEPVKVEITSGRAILWNNRRNGPVEVIMGSQSFIINSSESQMFNPSADFEYDVVAGERFIGTGNVVVQ